MNAVLAPPDSPYRGLVPFGDSERDAVLFFGRDREREVIVANLMASRLTLLYGPSGVGKSSLLRAGVAHHLRSLAAENVTRGEPPQLGVAVFAEWSDEPVAGIVRAAADEVERLAGERPELEPGGSLADALDTCASALGGELYVILDQAEEYFTYRDRNGRLDRFAAEFADAVNRRDVRAHFVLSIREDELARLDAFKAAIPGIFGNFLRLDRLDRRAAREAIEGPVAEHTRLRGAGVAIEPALVDAVLDQVSVGRLVGVAGSDAPQPADEKRIEAPYLQLVMQRIWEAERASASTVLRAQTLTALGGATRIVGEHLERALASLNPAQKDAAASMFTYLVTPSGSKIAHAPRDLADYAGVDQPRAEAVLAALAAKRIVRPVEALGGDGARYEIFHDVLGDTVMSWRSAYIAERRLERERAAAGRRQRQLLTLAAAALIGLAIVGAIAGYAIWQRGEARSQARSAEAQRLVVSAQSQIDTDPELSMLLALDAAQLERTPAVEDVLRSALVRSRARGAFDVGAPALAAAFVRGPTGGRLGDPFGGYGAATVNRNFQSGGVVAVTNDGRLHLPDGRVRRLAPAASVAAFDPRGRRVAVADGANVVVEDVVAKRVARRVRMPSAVGHLALGAYQVAIADRSGHVAVFALNRARPFRIDVKTAATALALHGPLLAVASHNTVRIFHLPRRRAIARFEDRGAVSAIAISPRGRALATAAADGGVRTWTIRGRLTNVLGAFVARGTAVAWTPDGNRVVVGLENGDGALRRVKDARDMGVYLGHDKEVVGLAVQTDGVQAASASLDGTVRVWDALGDGQLKTLAPLRRDPTGLVWRRAGPVPVFVDDGNPRIDPRARVAGRDVRLPGGVVLRDAGDRVLSVRFSRDGRRVATADALGIVRIWRALATAPPLAVSRHQSPIHDANFSPNRHWLVSAAARAVFLWDISDEADPQLVALLAGHTDVVVSSLFSPDGHVIVSTALDRTVRAYRCEICGGLDTLVPQARAQVALVGRRYLPAEQRKYVDEP